MTTYSVRLLREADGRFIAEVLGLSGALAYGLTEAEALRRVQALVLRVRARGLLEGDPPIEALRFVLGPTER